MAFRLIHTRVWNAFGSGLKAQEAIQGVSVTMNVSQRQQPEQNAFEGCREWQDTLRKDRKIKGHCHWVSQTLFWLSARSRYLHYIKGSLAQTSISCYRLIVFFFLFWRSKIIKFHRKAKCWPAKGSQHHLCPELFVTMETVHTE